MNYKLALDTNAYTALGVGNKSIAELVARAPQIGLPSVVLGEIYFGIYNGGLKDKNNESLARFMQNPRVTLLDINEDTTRLFGETATQLRKDGKAIQQNDIWIAALCKQYNYVLATKDAGFEAVTGLQVASWG